MTSTKAASRYAKALLDLAIETNQIDSVLKDMNYLHSVTVESPDFALLIKSPIVNSDKKISIFRQLFGDFHELSIKFIELITKKRRESFLGEIASAFQVLVNQHQGITPLTLISAKPLDEVTKTLILSKVQSLTSGKTVKVTEKIDSDLIGGFIVQVDDKQIDASVASQLNNLKQRLTR